MATSEAAMRPRQRVTSTRSPAKPRSAGRSVREAMTVTATTRAAPTASPWTKLTPITSMPSSEITTVVPAKVTARPAVSRAMDVESATEWPLCRFSR
jgi:hypothetical protein